VDLLCCGGHLGPRGRRVGAGLLLCRTPFSEMRWGRVVMVVVGGMRMLVMVLGVGSEGLRKSLERVE